MPAAKRWRAAARASFPDGACHGDPALSARLEAPLAAHEQPLTLLATQAEAAPPDLWIGFAKAAAEAVGQTPGYYKLLERIGEGGCGVVYVAEQTEPVRRRPALANPAPSGLRARSFGAFSCAS